MSPRADRLRMALDDAWQFRVNNGSLAARGALRVYHGATEGHGSLPLIAVEKFGDHYWIFEWESETHPAWDDETDTSALLAWLKHRGACSAVWLRRPKKGVPAENAVILCGDPPGAIEVVESAETQSRFEIRFQSTRHPGLFLDHFPLRQWLGKNSTGKRVLNTFAYTGSLSVAAMRGQAAETLTLDLSRPTIEWAKRNADLNPGLPAKTDFVYGDVFEWLPKLAKKGRRFETVILDPPSFSRTKSGNFSTSRDLPELHALALALLEPRGHLITSINSEKITPEEFLREVRKGAGGRRLDLVQLLSACPDTFPRATHLKGAIFRA